MRAVSALVIVAIAIISAKSDAQDVSIQNGNAIPEDVLLNYRLSYYDFILNMYRVIIAQGHDHFVYCPLSIWLILGALAEGAQGPEQQLLLHLLQLPEELQSRTEFYRIAASRYLPDKDVDIYNTRTFVADKGLRLNATWRDFVDNNSLLNIVTAPIKEDPEAAARHAKEQLSLQLTELDLSGNSFLLDALDYNGLWTTAFADAVIERAPFYDQHGNRTGAVDLMRLRRHVRLAYIEKLSLKYIELPVGVDQRYKMIFGILLDPKSFKSFMELDGNGIIDLLKELQWTDKPLDVAIPRFKLSSEVDVKSLLNEMGVDVLWGAPDGSSAISSPPALPSSFVQRATITLNNAGVEPAEEVTRVGKGLDLSRETAFVADRPFLFGLFDTQTRTCLTAAQYSQPTYRD